MIGKNEPARSVYILYFRFISQKSTNPNKIFSSYIDYIFQTDPCESIRYV